jgi:hypothetical protein
MAIEHKLKWRAMGPEDVPNKIMVKVGRKGMYPGASVTEQVITSDANFVEVWTEEESKGPLRGGLRIDE